MRIMIVNSFYYPEVKGGAEYSVKKLAEKLKKEGHTVLVIASGHYNLVENIDGIDVHRLKLKAIYHSYGSVKKNLIKMFFHRLLDFYNVFNKKILKNEIKMFCPDIIHTNGLYEITPIIWKIGYDMNIPVVHTIRDFYLACPKTNLLKKNGEVCVRANLICQFYRHINRYFTRYVDYITAPSHMMISQIEQLLLFNNSQKKAVYNACEYNQEDVRTILELRKKELPDKKNISFVYLGGLHLHKGISTMLDAFSLIKNENVELYIAGKGVEVERVKNASKNDKRIHYLGFLNEKELNDLLKKCNVLLCPSIWNEPFGRVILDAYMNGMPVIASRIGALPETIIDNKTGLLVSPGDIDELRDAMERFANEKALMYTCFENIEEKLSNYHIQAQYESFLSIYNSLLK